jgi:DNA-directed RNA polymerase specialized sigma subunit
MEKIDELDDPLYVEILESFFIDCKTIPEIAEELDYSERHIARKYSEAIVRLNIEWHLYVVNMT